MERYSGFFSNANEAGIISLSTFVLMLWMYDKSKFFVYLLGAIISALAVFFTFSKSSIICLFILIIVYLLTLRKFSGLFLVLLVFSFSGLLFFMPELFIDDLNISQENRLQSVQLFLSGNVNADTTTGRTELWKLGLSHAVDNLLIVGSGLGSFHSLKGAMIEYDVVQGVHNTYLMLLGEAGILVLGLFVLANILVLVLLWQKRLFFLLLYMIVLQVDLLAAHNVLGLRFHDFLIGYMLGLIACKQRQDDVFI